MNTTSTSKADKGVADGYHCRSFSKPIGAVVNKIVEIRKRDKLAEAKGYNHTAMGFCSVVEYVEGIDASYCF